MLLAVQHERKPIVDRKDNKSSTPENDQEMMSQSKSRLKKDSANDSVNYLSLFQLNPLLMHAASGVHQAQAYKPPPSKADLSGIKEEPYIDDFCENKVSTINEPASLGLFESALEQKLFDMINSIEASLQSNHQVHNNGTSDDNLSDMFMNNLTDENVTQFKIQLPNLLPKMHFVCEVGSRILFKSIDWLRDVQTWPHFDAEAQTEILKFNWTELLILGLGQIISSSQQTAQLKSMVISTLVNYVKSLIIYSSTNEQNQMNVNNKTEAKPPSGQKLKKMLMNITMINQFIDQIMQLDLDVIEFAHLRILCMFNPNKCYSADYRLKSRYEKVTASLQNYLRGREKSQLIANERVLAIFQASNVLPSLDGKIIEKLFFNILVDFIKIDNVIPYIINLNGDSSENKHNMKKEPQLDLNDENNSLSMNSDDQRYYINNYSGDEK